MGDILKEQYNINIIVSPSISFSAYSQEYEIKILDMWHQDWEKNVLSIYTVSIWLDKGI